MAEEVKKPVSGWHAFLKEKPEERKKFNASADRNKEPILQTMKKYLPPQVANGPCHLIEIASGTGQHMNHFMANIPDLHYQPTDFDLVCLASIEEWIKETEGKDRISPPLHVDATKPFETWGVAANSKDVFFNSNTIHISPPAVMEGIITGAAHALKKGGRFMIYGPFKLGGKFTTESNQTFDEKLRSVDSSWGYRNFEDVDQKVRELGFKFLAREEMPANNFMIIWEKL